MQKFVYWKVKKISAAVSNQIYIKLQLMQHMNKIFISSQIFVLSKTISIAFFTLQVIFLYQ